MLQIETTGKNIDIAIDNALFELKAVREDVDITILEEGGFFKKAKVMVKISDDCKDRYLKLHGLQNEEKAKEQTIEEVKVKPKQTQETPYVKKEEKPGKETGKAGIEFLKGLLEQLNIKADIEYSQNGKDMFFDLTGDNLSALIGHRGEVMYAVQFLLSVIETREDRGAGRVLLNVDKYKEQREIQLIDLAAKQADRCKRFGKVIKLDPMNSYERKIVHTALQEDKDVETHSEGEEPNRFLVIAPKRKERVAETKVEEVKQTVGEEITKPDVLEVSDSVYEVLDSVVEEVLPNELEEVTTENNETV